MGRGAEVGRGPHSTEHYALFLSPLEYAAPPRPATEPAITVTIQPVPQTYGRYVTGRCGAARAASSASDTSHAHTRSRGQC